MNINWHDKELTFEEVYPKAEFSELIRLVLVLADAVRRLWAGMNRVRTDLRRSHPNERMPERQAWF